MAERQRSKDGTRDSEKVLDEPGAPGGQGRAGGRLAREIGTEDEQKRAFERPAGKTGVTKSKQEDAG